MHIVECGVDTRHDSPEFMLIIGREMMEELLGCAWPWCIILDQFGVDTSKLNGKSHLYRSTLLPVSGDLGRSRNVTLCRALFENR